MGLIDRNEADGFYSPYIEHYNNMNNDNRNAPPTDSDDSDAASLDNHTQRRQPRTRRTRHVISFSQENLANSYGRQLGRNKRRRLDNMKFLMSLDEKDSEGGESFDSFLEPTTTFFGKLLNDPDQMAIWNNFVESSEEEQYRILNYRGLHNIKEEKEEEESEDMCVEQQPSSEESWVMILDKRSTHPAYSPKECYSRVDKGLRTLLKRRQLPMGMLCNLEREVVTFFTEWPNSVYVCDIGNRFERMLLHGLCQYLKLSSKSFNADGRRKTQIENKMSDFRPPSQLLTEYLQQNQGSL